MGEIIWKPVAGTCGKYLVSEFGDIMSKYRESKYHKFYRDSIVKPSRGGKKKKYLKVTLRWRNENNEPTQRNESIHRLVAIAFVPAVEGKPHVNHIDGNKLNNYYTNLEWCTPQENNEHGVRIGLLKRGRTVKQYVSTKKGWNSGRVVLDTHTGVFYYSCKEAALFLNMKKKKLYKMLSGEVVNNTGHIYA